jgi:hypothetical protein
MDKNFPIRYNQAISFQFSVPIASNAALKLNSLDPGA